MTKEKKDFLRTPLRTIAADRPFFAALIGVFVAGIIYMLVMGFTLQVRDVQVYVRYTAFGEAHFYKSYWYYLLSFVLFGALVMVVHIGLMVKLYSLQRRQTALFVGAAAVLVLLVAASYGLAVMHLAYR
ncbi:MAG: hypothetical protein Q4B27_01130 [Candidatus Saccharibacteria bacterium]|jgi:hypothetical protein cdiviTM7_00316|nr:hypothetical protein [Candidatus Saccharibacteria bacterium]MBF1032535.1 hypothetical protein [Candidatus Nanosynbacter sp.]MDO4660734.1 hypothetical protein [Candidatus Saccharibacteria bacterium]